MKNKKALIAVAMVFLCIIAAVSVGLAVAFDDGDAIVLNDSSGEAFATVSWDGYDLKYDSENSLFNGYAAYIFEEAKNILIEENNLKVENAEDYIFKKISYINTNFKPEIQLAVIEGVKKTEALNNAVCSVAVTDLSGRVVAVYSNESDYSVKKTYAGSTIKPLSIYAPAIDSGIYSWSSMFVDEPFKKIQEPDGSFSDWPANSDGKYSYDSIPLAEALTYSTNTVAVRLLDKVGVEKSLRNLESKYGLNLDYERSKMNSSGEAEILSSIALGYLYDGASVVDMAGFYQAFANEGSYIKPSGITEISDGNTSIYKTRFSSVRVMKPETAAIMNKMLQRVVSLGTGKQAKLEAVEVAGKTGTTSGNADNWFVGYTPEYSCAVWHSSASEGNVAPAAFANIFKNIPSHINSFKDRGNIDARLYCEKSGLLRGENCLYCNKGYYIKNQNIKQCNQCG